MNRALKNKTRGNQAAPAPAFSPANQTAALLAKYNDKANIEAGTIDQRVIKPLGPTGDTASWVGAMPPNS